MIFQQVAEIKDGRKIRTCRARKPGEELRGTGEPGSPKTVYSGVDGHGARRIKWMVGRQYSIVPKRGLPGIGSKIQIVDIQQIRVGALTEQQYREEGVADRAAYVALWDKINDKRVLVDPVFGNIIKLDFASNPEVWMIEFKFVP